MSSVLRILPAVALALSGLIGGTALTARPMTAKHDTAALDDTVAPVVKRTRTTTATYAVYYWNAITPSGGEASQEWSAEFNRGNWHRVETPRDRMIADCRKMTGMDINLETGQVSSGPAIARAACGINANRPLQKGEYVGRMTGRFGPFERVRLIDAGDVRTYDIDANGVILGVTYAPVDKPEATTLTMTSAGLDAKLPDNDIFSPQSLGRSVVPDQYKRAPKGG